MNGISVAADISLVSCLQRLVQEFHRKIDFSTPGPTVVPDN